MREKEGKKGMRGKGGTKGRKVVWLKICLKLKLFFFS